MKQKITSLLVLLLCMSNIIGYTQSLREKAAYFKIPAGVNLNDYIPDIIVFKVKPQYRSICRATSIENEKLNKVLRIFSNYEVKKIFPNTSSPDQERNAQGQKLIDLSLIYQIKINADQNLVKSINSILTSGFVEYAEPYYIYQSNYLANDPSLTSNPGQYFINKISANLAWDIQKGDTNIVIGIDDTGTDWDHPDLAANVKLNYADPINGIDDDNDGYIDNFRGWDLAGSDYNNVVEDNDPNSTGGNNNHGSHVSGCAAAVTDNATGVAGVGFKCKFLPVKTSADNDFRGSGGAAYLIRPYEGITYAADHGCSIINCSWGGGGGGQLGQDVIDYATFNKNALVIVSAGNNASEIAQYPASYEHVIAVASTGTNDSHSSFTSYGYFVDVSAPGSGIYSTIYNNSYASLSGTSMASPITAGAAAIVKSQFPTYTAMQLGERLRTTCDNIYGVAGNGGNYLNKLGRGRINLFNALTAASTPSVRFENKITTDNNDNSFVIGDTLSISGNFINYLDATSNLTVTLSSTSTYVTILNSVYNIGALATFATSNNSNSPYTVLIKPGTPTNAVITFTLTYTDGTYSDIQLLKETVNVDYINITINDVYTTITSKGLTGWNQFGQIDGLGFDYLGNQLCYEAGLMIGSNSNVSDNVREYSTANNDFGSVLAVQKVNPSIQSEYDLFGRFNDNGAASSLKTLVTHKALAWSTPGNRKYVIVEYNIKNAGTALLDQLYAGIFADWDIMTASLNKASVDNTTRMGYVYSTETNGLFAGIKLLTPGQFTHYAIDNVGGGGGGIDITTNPTGFSSALKYTSLSTNRVNAGGSGTGNDVCDVVSSGPFTINPGDSVIVAFALIAGDSLSDLINSAENAQIQYDNLTSVDDITGDANSIHLSAYPNPATDLLTVNFNLPTAAKATLAIYNSLGQVVYKFAESNYFQGNQSIQINIDKFENGLYFYKLNVDNKSYLNKFTVSH